MMAAILNQTAAFSVLLLVQHAQTTVYVNLVPQVMDCIKVIAIHLAHLNQTALILLTLNVMPPPKSVDHAKRTQNAVHKVSKVFVILYQVMDSVLIAQALHNVVIKDYCHNIVLDMPVEIVLINQTVNNLLLKRIALVALV